MVSVLCDIDQPDHVPGGSICDINQANLDAFEVLGIIKEGA